MDFLAKIRRFGNNFVLFSSKKPEMTGFLKIEKALNDGISVIFDSVQVKTLWFYGFFQHGFA